MKQFYVAVTKHNDQMGWVVWENYPGKELPDDLTHFFLVDAVNKTDAVARIMCGEGRTLITPKGNEKLMMVPS